MKKKVIIDGQETNYSVFDDGRVFNDKTQKELKGTYGSNEYHRVQLTINGKPKSIMTHRLVAQAFCENPNNYDIVDHIDRNKYNNNASNLRWVSAEENSRNVVREKERIVRKVNYDEVQGDWRPLKDFPDYLINTNGEIINTVTNCYMIGSNRNDYRRVNIKGSILSIHRLVWETFVGEIPEGKIIDHIDGDKSNNKLENLRLATISENKTYADEKGKGYQVKILQYSLEGDFIKEFPTIAEAAREIGVSHPAIRSAIQRFGSCKNYFWVKEAEDIKKCLEQKDKKHNFEKRKVYQYDKESNLIHIFDSISEAARSIDAPSTSFRSSLDKDKIYKDFYWRTIKI